MSAKTDEKTSFFDGNGADSGQKGGKMGGSQLLIGKYAENASR
ncbi:MAG: hypothetical protein ABR907_07725 [Terracidiphilus sp.]